MVVYGSTLISLCLVWILQHMGIEARRLLKHHQQSLFVENLIHPLVLGLATYIQNVHFLSLASR